MKILKQHSAISVIYKIVSEKLIKEFFFNNNLKYIINRFGVYQALGNLENKIKDLYRYGSQDIF